MQQMQQFIGENWVPNFAVVSTCDSPTLTRYNTRLDQKIKNKKEEEEEEEEEDKN